MKGTLISNRYSKALFELALELNQLDKVKQDMEVLAAVCRGSREFISAMRSPVIKADKKISVISALFKQRFTPLSFRFIELITRKGRGLYYQGIAEHFMDLYRHHHNILPVSLTTAATVDESIKQKISALLHQHTNAQIELTEIVDPEIIGGFVLTFGDRQYDASLQRRIMQLRNEFNINLYIRGF